MDCRGTQRITYIPSTVRLSRFANKHSHLQLFISLELSDSLTLSVQDNMEITIKQDVLRLLLIVLWSSGLTDASVVNQTSILWKKQGEDATMDCSHNKDASYSQMYWYRQLPGETMKLIVFTRIGNNNHDFGDFSKDKFSATKPDFKRGTFTVKNVQPEDQGLYFCAVDRGDAAEAYFGGGTKLTVLEAGREATPPKSVKILPPSPNECRNQKDKKRKKTLVCVASDFYPDHVKVSWTINDKEVSDGVATDSAAKRIEQFYRITSRLRVPAEIYNTASSKFTCIVSFFDGTATTTHEKSINGIQGKAEGGMTREKYLKITQGAKLSYIVVIVKSCFFGLFVGIFVWKLQGSARKHH